MKFWNSSLAESSLDTHLGRRDPFYRQQRSLTDTSSFSALRLHSLQFTFAAVYISVALLLSRSDPHARGEIRYIRDSRCLSGNDAVFFALSSRSREGEAWDIMQLGYGGINISCGDRTHLGKARRPDEPFLDRAILDDKQSAFGSWLSYRLCCYRSLRKHRQRNRGTITLHLISLMEFAKFFRAPILLFRSFANRPNKWTPLGDRLDWTEDSLSNRSNCRDIFFCENRRVFYQRWR